MPASSLANSSCGRSVRNADPYKNRILVLRRDSNGNTRTRNKKVFSKRRSGEISLEQNKRHALYKALSDAVLKRIVFSGPEALQRENADLRRQVDELKRECDRLRSGRFIEGDLVPYGTERKYLSCRGFPLIWSVPEAPITQTITAEFYVKWYELYTLHTDGHAEKLPYEVLEEYTPSGESTYRDHVPNPKAVHNFAEEHNYSIDLIFWEVLQGRWLEETFEPVSR